MTGVLLLLAPPLLLALALLLGRRPGEQAIERLRARLCAAPGHRRRRPVTALPRLLIAPVLPRGGQLVAAAVAARPPPGG